MGMRKLNEKWSHIADITERRRAQNRVAQKTYREKRKKLQLNRVALASSELPPDISHPLSLAPNSKSRPPSRYPLMNREQMENYVKVEWKTSEARYELPFNSSLPLAATNNGTMFEHQDPYQLSTSLPPFCSTSGPYHHYFQDPHSPKNAHPWPGYTSPSPELVNRTLVPTDTHGLGYHIAHQTQQERYYSEKFPQNCVLDKTMGGVVEQSEDCQADAPFNDELL